MIPTLDPLLSFRFIDESQEVPDNLVNAMMAALGAPTHYRPGDDVLESDVMNTFLRLLGERERVESEYEFTLEDMNGVLDRISARFN